MTPFIFHQSKNKGFCGRSHDFGIDTCLSFCDNHYLYHFILAKAINCNNVVQKE